MRQQGQEEQSCVVNKTTELHDGSPSNNFALFFSLCLLRWHMLCFDFFFCTDLLEPLMSPN